MFILYYVSRDLEFWLVNHTSISVTSQLVFRNTKFLGEIVNNWPGTNVYKTLDDNRCW